VLDGALVCPPRSPCLVHGWWIAVPLAAAIRHSCTNGLATGLALPAALADAATYASDAYSGKFSVFNHVSARDLVKH
jgi:hypothetical protein